MLDDIGGIIKQSIIEHNLTQKQVAEMVHISPQTLSSFVNNRRTPNLECFFDLVDLLDLNDQFFKHSSFDETILDTYLTKIIPSLPFEQKRLLFFLTQYMDKQNKKEPE